MARREGEKAAVAEREAARDGRRRRSAACGVCEEIRGARARRCAAGQPQVRPGLTSP